MDIWVRNNVVDMPEIEGKNLQVYFRMSFSRIISYFIKYIYTYNLINMCINGIVFLQLSLLQLFSKKFKLFFLFIKLVKK